jgi:hypothetical protein
MTPWSFQDYRSAEVWSLLVGGLLATAAAAAVALRSVRRQSMQVAPKCHPGVAPPT